MDRADVEQDLDEFVEGEAWPEALESGEPVPVPDPTAVSRILRRLKRLDRDKALIQKVADDEVARITAFTEDRVSGINREIAWGEQALENFMRIHGEATKKRSLPLADGTLKLTKPSERVEITDPRAFLEWCGVVFPPDVDGKTQPPDVGSLTHPEFIKLEPVPIKTPIKTLLTRGPENKEVPDIVSMDLLFGPKGQTEIVPGVAIVKDAADNFNIVLGAD